MSGVPEQRGRTRNFHNDLCCHCSQVRACLRLLASFLNNYEINSKKNTEVFGLKTENTV